MTMFRPDFDDAARQLGAEFLFHNGNMRVYVKHMVELVKSDVRLSKGERHKRIREWCQYLDDYETDQLYERMRKYSYRYDD